MYASAKDLQCSWFITLCYAMSAQLISIGVCISMYVVIHRFGGSEPLSLIIAILFYLVYCFKEYAKMQSSHSDGYFGLVKDHTLKQICHKYMTNMIAFICALGLELLFIVGTLAFAIKGIASYSPVIAKILIVGSGFLACIHMPVNFVFYENCVRKYFKVPKKIKKEISAKKSTFVFFCIIGCITFSSVLIFIRCILTCYAFFKSDQVITSYEGVFVGLIFGTLSLYANYCIMHQTFCESSRYFAKRSQGNRWLKALFSFKSNGTERGARWFSSLSYAIYYSQPAIYMIFTSALIVHLNSLFRASLALLCTTVMLLSYYLLTQNYLERLFVVKCHASAK